MIYECGTEDLTEVVEGQDLPTTFRIVQGYLQHLLVGKQVSGTHLRFVTLGTVEVEKPHDRVSRLDQYFLAFRPRPFDGGHSFRNPSSQSPFSASNHLFGEFLLIDFHGLFLRAVVPEPDQPLRSEVAQARDAGCPAALHFFVLASKFGQDDSDENIRVSCTIGTGSKPGGRFSDDITSIIAFRDNRFILRVQAHG